MNPRWSWLRRVLLVLLCALARPAAAQQTSTAETTSAVPASSASAASSSSASPAPRDARAIAAVKEWFAAAQAAYEAGDYLAAIQALEAANELSPSPALAFSIAQTEREQFLVDGRPERILRAVALYRRYLDEDPKGKRRKEALDALAQLEPQLAKLQSTGAGAAAAPGVQQSTRILVLCELPEARISVDGAEPAPSPLIREVAPGNHEVVVRAPGHHDSVRQVVAVLGELVPITVSLAELPARVRLSAPHDAEVYVDGVLVSQGAKDLELELPSGQHHISVAEKGHRLATQTLELGRGETRTAHFELERTRQRLASHGMLVAGAAALAAGGAFTFLAVRSESQAKSFLERQERAAASPAELVRYNADVASRNQFRWMAVGAFTSSLGLLVTGLILHELDMPGPDELYRFLPPREGAPSAEADQTKTSLSLAAMIAPDQYGASLRGEF